MLQYDGMTGHYKITVNMIIFCRQVFFAIFAIFFLTQKLQSQNIMFFNAPGNIPHFGPRLCEV